MSARSRVIYSDQVCQIGFWQNVLLVEVASDIDLEHMERLGKAHHELLADWPNGIVTLAIIRAGVPVASTAARDESARFIKALGESLRRTILVLEDRGIVAQLLHTVIRGINVIVRNAKLAIVPTLHEAVTAVGPMVDGLPKAQARAELAEAVTGFRAGYRSGKGLSATA